MLLLSLIPLLLLIQGRRDQGPASKEGGVGEGEGERGGGGGCGEGIGRGEGRGGED